MQTFSVGRLLNRQNGSRASRQVHIAEYEIRTTNGQVYMVSNGHPTFG